MVLSSGDMDGTDGKGLRGKREVYIFQTLLYCSILFSDHELLFVVIQNKISENITRICTLKF